jgi:hypothetical protein
MDKQDKEDKTPLEGCVTYTYEDAEVAVYHAYVKCKNAAQNASLPFDCRTIAKEHADQLFEQVSIIQQNIFSDSTPEFQKAAGEMIEAVGEIQNHIVELKEAIEKAKKIAEFAKFLDDVVTLAVQIAAAAKP